MKPADDTGAGGLHVLVYGDRIVYCEKLNFALWNSIQVQRADS